MEAVLPCRKEQEKGPKLIASGPGIEFRMLRQHVGRGDRGAQVTGRIVSDCGTSISATRRTRRNFAGRVQFDIRRQVTGIGDGVTRCFALFDGELLGRGVNLPQVVDARIGLGRGPGLHEVGNGDSRQKADNGHNDHDFHQCEA